MKKILMASLFLFVSNVIRGFNPYRKASVDLTRLKISIWYLQSIKTLRLLFISLLGAGVCLVLLMSGLVLFHLAIVLYAPWDPQVKMGVTLLCAAIYILIAIGLFSYVFAEDKWLKIFNAHGLMKEFTDFPEPEAKREEKRDPSNN
ncbi:MAG: hypothetical protein Q7S13_05500 [Candidatus Omnitrophota bacterium]|nr:hypothetical protein [Candidatus Omnitrophota bacterium]